MPATFITLVYFFNFEKSLFTSKIGLRQNKAVQKLKLSKNIKTVPTLFLSRVMSPFTAMVKKFSTLGVTLQPELKTGMIYSKWEK